MVIQLLVFELAQQRYGLPLKVVEKVIDNLSITKPHGAHRAVLGVVDFQGRSLPVLNLRQNFRLSEKDLEMSDRFIVVVACNRSVILVADNVIGVVEIEEDQIIAGKTVLPGLEYVEGIVQLPDGLILIHNLDQLLSLDELNLLSHALN